MYTLEIATKGLIGETTPRIFRKSVTAVYVAPVLTTITKCTQEGKEDDKLTMGLAYKILGTNLALGAGDQVKLELLEGTEVMYSVDQASKIVTSAAGEISLSGMNTEGEPTAWIGTSTRVVVIKGGTRVEHSVEFD